MQENCAHIPKRCIPMSLESEDSYSCASSLLPFPEELEDGEFLRLGPSGPEEVMGIPGTQPVSWSPKPHQIAFPRKRSLGCWTRAPAQEEKPPLPRWSLQHEVHGSLCGSSGPAYCSWVLIPSTDHSGEGIG